LKAQTQKGKKLVYYWCVYKHNRRFI